ncbi:hypothetical protein VYI39_09615, partial [Streptococcus anginosus]|nr:hypothetical protein [Streptococcus anginosus]
FSIILPYLIVDLKLCNRTIFLNNPELLSLAFPNLKSDSIKKKKTRVRKLLREETNQFAEELKEVLIQNLPKLNTELQLLVGEFLNLENK